MQKHHSVVVVGAGLSGLSTAHFLRKRSPDLDVVLLEQDERPGGAMMSFEEQGFRAEWGPHGFLDNTPESQELLHDTGLYEHCQQAPLGDFYRYVCHKGRLVRLPQSFFAVLTTPLVSFWGKLRALADLWRKPKHEDMSIGDWVAYRFGKSILPLVDAAVTGSFAGDYTKLSIDAVMPGVRRLEKETGSVVRGLIKMKKEKAEQRKKMRLPSMLNFPEGIETLIKAMSASHNIQFNTTVQAIEHTDNIWHIQTNQETYTADAVVLALPVNASLKLLKQRKEPPVQSTPTSQIYNVVLGFTDDAKVPYGFGYLAPEREKRFTLGVMFTSHMFPNRAPEGHVLMEALVGGRRHPERLELSDEELIENVLDDIKQLIDLPEKPVFASVLRTQNCIPQMEMDHPKLQEWRNAIEQEENSLYLCGFGWDGIGINDMIKSAKKAAEALAEGRERAQEQAKVKPIYF